MMRVSPLPLLELRHWHLPATVRISSFTARPMRRQQNKPPKIYGHLAYAPLCILSISPTLMPRKD